jgi:phosphatidylglycerophosphatase A
MFVLFGEVIFIVCFSLVAGIVGFVIYGFIKGWKNVHLEEASKNE